VKPAVVIDVNIILSAAISKNGIPSHLVELFVREGLFEIVVSPAIIAEWSECVSRKSIQKAARATEAQLQAFIASIVVRSTLVDDSVTAQGICREAGPIFKKFHHSLNVLNAGDYGCLHLISQGQDILIYWIYLQ
jgi:putative PIN family toxin of toxin-antitoxin system